MEICLKVTNESYSRECISITIKLWLDLSMLEAVYDQSVSGYLCQRHPISEHPQATWITHTLWASPSSRYSMLVPHAIPHASLPPPSCTALCCAGPQPCCPMPHRAPRSTRALPPTGSLSDMGHPTLSPRERTGKQSRRGRGQKQKIWQQQ